MWDKKPNFRAIKSCQNDIMISPKKGNDTKKKEYTYYKIAFFLKRFPEKQMKFFSKEKNRHELAFWITSEASTSN